jgi:hypothetical protein
VLHARAGGRFKFDLDINNKANPDPPVALNGWMNLARQFADVMATMQIRDLPDAAACGWQRGFPAITFSNTQCELNQVFLARIRRERIWQLFVDMYPTGIIFEDEPEPFTYLPPPMLFCSAARKNEPLSFDDCIVLALLIAPLFFGKSTSSSSMWSNVSIIPISKSRGVC